MCKIGLLQNVGQIQNFLKNQFCFRQGKPTVNVIIYLVESIANSLDNHNITLSVFFYLYKVLDCVDHSLLLGILVVLWHSKMFETQGVKVLPSEQTQQVIGNRVLLHTPL